MQVCAFSAPPLVQKSIFRLSQKYFIYIILFLGFEKASMKESVGRGKIFFLLVLN